MGERKEYFLVNVPDEKIRELRKVLVADLGQANKAQTFPLEQEVPYTGDADIWQPDERCVLVFNKTNAVHAQEIDTDSRIGRLLEELENLYLDKEE